MQLNIEVLLDYAIPEPADVLLQIEVAAMADQRLLQADLTVTSPEPLRATPGEEAIGQRCWALGKGRLTATYSARVAIDRVGVPLEGLAAADPRDLPGSVVPYVMASRYVESDLFEAFVGSEFGGLRGGAQIVAMRDWIFSHIRYVSGTSDGKTTAAETFVRREGVCRDFAHLMAAFARAAHVPARLVSAYAPGVEPPDFHAVVEVWLDGAWHLVDATGMARTESIARIAVGRDATDIAFMTIFGTADLLDQRVAVHIG